MSFWSKKWGKAFTSLNKCLTYLLISVHIFLLPLKEKFQFGNSNSLYISWPTFQIVLPEWVICFFGCLSFNQFNKRPLSKLNISRLQSFCFFGFLETCGAVIMVVDNWTKWVAYTVCSILNSTCFLNTLAIESKRTNEQLERVEFQ